MLRDRDWVEKQLSAATGISQAHINRMKKGQSEGSPASMRKIAEAFGTTVADMLTTGDLLADGKNPHLFRNRGPHGFQIEETAAGWCKDPGKDRHWKVDSDKHRMLKKAYKILIEGGHRADALTHLLNTDRGPPETGQKQITMEDHLHPVTRDRLINHLLDQISELKAEIKNLRSQNQPENDGKEDQ